MKRFRSVVLVYLLTPMIALFAHVNFTMANTIDWTGWHRIASEQAITEDRIRSWKSVPSTTRAKVVRELNELEMLQASLLMEGRIFSPIAWHKIAHRHDKIEDSIRSWKSVPSNHRQSVVNALDKHQLDRAKLRSKN